MHNLIHAIENSLISTYTILKDNVAIEIINVYLNINQYEKKYRFK